MLAPMFRAVRRHLGPACLALAVLTLAGCGGVGQPAPYDASGIDGLEVPTPSPDPADFVTDLDNPWLGWERGESRRYVVTREGREVGEMVVQVGVQTVDVAGVATTPVRETLRVKGRPVAETVDYVAQDTSGNVWWLGHDSRAARTWRAGGGTEAGVLLPRAPRLGDGWVTVSLPDGDIVTRVQDRTVVNGWDGVVQTSYEADTEQERYYAEGVGLVRIVDLDEGLVVDLEHAVR